MSKEFTKSYAINRIAELNEQIVEMTDNQNQTMRYLNRIRDENNQLKQQLEEKDKEIERLKVFEKAYYYNQLQASQEDIQKFQNLANQSAVNINYIAIQELEKVKDTLKHFCDIHSDEYYGVKAEVKGIELDVCESIDYQIRELKGE